MEVPSAIPSAAGQANVPMAAPADTGSWRQTVTREEREHMLREILKVLHQRSPTTAGADQDKLKKLVLNIESRFLSVAKSKEEYLNLETLYERIRTLIHRHGSSSKLSSGGAGTVQQQTQAQQQPQVVGTSVAVPANPPVNDVAAVPNAMATAAADLQQVVKQEYMGYATMPPQQPAACTPAQHPTLGTAYANAMPSSMPQHHLQQLQQQHNAAPMYVVHCAPQSNVLTLQHAQQQAQPMLPPQYGAVNPAIVAVQQHNANGGMVNVGADGNGLAVAGAPAGASDAESVPHQGMHVDYNAAVNGAMQPLQPFMSNGAPVLMRNSVATTQPAVGGGGMIHMGGLGGVPGAAGMPPTVKLEGGGNPMVSFGNAMPGGGVVPATTSAGLVSMYPTQPAAPPQFAQLNMVPQNGSGVAGASLDELFGSVAAANGGEIIHVGSGSGVAGGGLPMPIDARKSQILKQQRWLLFLRHCAKCTMAETECSYGNNCTIAKQLWYHLIGCKDPKCTYPRCLPSRELLRHHQKCTSVQCPVCAPVKEYVSRQKEQLIARRLDANGYTPEEREQYMRHLKARRAALQASVAATAGIQGATNSAGAPSAAAAATAGAGAAGTGTSRQQSGTFMAPIVDTQATKRPRILLQEEMGTSLLEYFNADQIDKHMKLLQSTSQQPSRRAAALSHTFGADGFLIMEEESTCKVCHMNKLTFEPPMLYCYHCNTRIKRQQVYYSTPKLCEVRAWVCHQCYTAAPPDAVMLDGVAFHKEQLEKRKNDQEQEEAWVQCDVCEGWVHQICGLFNKGRNNEERGYLCPPCLLDGLRRNQRRVPTERPQAMLTARDLPTCDLSEYLEGRLNKALSEESSRRAAATGLTESQIASAHRSLTVRVVNNVVKKCEVKPRFAQTVGASENYPEAFLYKQKVILLFQQLDGVDMCLYCLYVQEYGADAPAPNTRTVYLSYLDSVKYFQPEDVEAAGLGHRLRTMVYHEVLLGYLAYAKEHGFTSMYIWACPPVAGDDYIFYCHPNRQKNPRSDRLREWYLSMLRRSKSEGTVVYISNLYDTFFEGGRDHRVERPSVTALPYLEGDYWVGEAENLLAAAQNGGNAASDGHKGGRKSTKDKRWRPSPDASPGEQLLARLGENIRNMKEDFIVAHLYESCSHCRAYMDGGTRHYHPNPPSKVTLRSERAFDGIALDRPGMDAARTVALLRFQLCQSCYDREAGRLLPDKPPVGLPTGIVLADLVAAPCPPLPSQQDTVSTIDNEFFDTRHQFLTLCQGNHYQFDTVRRARHSSMMVLYHLHNPSEPAFTATCNACNGEIQPGEGFRCTVCSDFDMCAACNANPAVSHPHAMKPVARRKFDETRMRLTEEDRKKRDAMLHRTMQLLVHASACQDRSCPSSNCAKIKNLFQHAKYCALKLAGGCAYCRRIFALLQTHAKMCTEANCPVPRCQTLRANWRELATRQEDKRRAAYRQMLVKQEEAIAGEGKHGVDA